MGALAFDLEGLDSHATNIPPAPSVTSAQTAAEMVEHYWAALMRDVNFTDYATSPLAAQACADLNNLSYVRSHGSIFPYPVTPQNLFRGQFYPGDGNVQGPYVSQFLIQPTFLGVQPLSQMYQRFLSVGEGGPTTDQSHRVSGVQSGVSAVVQPAVRSTYRFLRMGRDWRRLHPRGRAASGVLCRRAGSGGYRLPGESRQSVHRFALASMASAPSAATQAGPVDTVGTSPRWQPEP